VCLGRYCCVHGPISLILQLMSVEFFYSYGGVVYAVGGGMSCCLKIVGSYNCRVDLYCGIVREVVPLVLTEMYLFDSESDVMF